MTGYCLTWRGGAMPAVVDGSFLRPDALGALDLTALERVTLRAGRESITLAEAFTIRKCPDARLVVVAAPALHRIGAGMTGGELIVEGDAGDDLGASMRGGTIRVQGEAGHRCGGPDHTSDRGMTGGVIVIRGRAGDHAGLRMRRGLIVALGGAAAIPGYRMLAGTLVIGAGTLDHPGLEMRRGTVLALDPASTLRVGANFRPVGEYAVDTNPVPTLIRFAVRETGVTLRAEHHATRYRLWTGDRFELGKGELWQAVS